MSALLAGRPGIWPSLPGREWLRRRRPGRGGRRLAIALAGIAALVVPFVASAPALAYNGPANNYACTPNGVPSYYQGEIDNLVSVTSGICASIPEGTYGQTSGYTTLDGDSVWYYVQQNPDGYTQLQLSGPGYWWAYWQQNPPEASHDGCSWYQEQVNTWSGGPYYFTTGWYCP
jgi:hypothetical protein